PTNQQQEVVEMLAEFLLSESGDAVFLLRGFAGTGKTALVSALVKSMEELNRECVLIAPTGRAAKVFSMYADHPAYTVHKRIYRQKSIDQDSLFTLNYNMKANLLFICDEASMISNEGLSASMYGTGRLLDDLVQFVYNGKGCRLILMGDTAQLPPVGEGESPALQDDVLSGYGLQVMSYTMTQVVRQAEDSGILWNATHLRELIHVADIFQLPKIRFQGFPDILNISGNELIETLEQCYHRDGYDETIVVTRSNKRANIYNNGIRAQILWRESELESGDMLMVAKNNYHYQPSDSDFVANGDIVRIQRVRNERELYGFRFVDAELCFPDYNDCELECTLMLDVLHTEAPALTGDQQQQLYNNVLADYEEINIAQPGERPQWKRATKSEKLKALRQDPYYNALQVKYAYAVTCHKAQGGQWTNVFIDQGYMTEEMLGPDYFRWLYTAITRATERVFLVNWPETQTE
ncbi:MAG: AAA family ATPase, partial [Bacteroidaceae bacterium]|nr:AAA family ATPase [Bacteroidaceae bacterium]